MRPNPGGAEKSRVFEAGRRAGLAASAACATAASNAATSCSNRRFASASLDADRCAVSPSRPLERVWNGYEKVLSP